MCPFYLIDRGEFVAMLPREKTKRKTLMVIVNLR